MRFMHTSGCINQQYPLATPIFKDQELCPLATPIFASLKPQNTICLFQIINILMLVIGEMFLKKRGCCFFFAPIVLGARIFTEKTRVFFHRRRVRHVTTPATTSRDPWVRFFFQQCWQPAKPCGNRWGGIRGATVLALEKGGERCVWNVSG